MIVVERPIVGYMIDPLSLAMAHEPAEIEEAIERQMRDAMALWALEHAVDIPAESIWVTRIEERAPVPGIRFTATWAPDPLRGCELRGGAADGTVLALPRQGSFGEPPAHYVVPGEPRDLYRAHASIGPDPGPRNLEVERFVYERAGIDAAEDRWVYRPVA